MVLYGRAPHFLNKIEIKDIMHKFIQLFFYDDPCPHIYIY